MDEENAHSLNLSTAPVRKVMMKYSIPCIISLLVASLYNIIDQIFIGWGVGAEGNGATNIVFPLTVLVLAVATMIGDGACSFVSISLGRKDSESAHRAVGNAIVLAVLAGLAFMAVYMIFPQSLLRLFGATDEVSDLTKYYAQRYFKWIAVGVPFYMFGQAMNPIIRSDGSPKIAMASTLSGAVTNIIFDPIFIFVFHWDVQGAAIATIMGQVVTAVISLVYITRMKLVKLNLRSFPLKGKLIGKFIPLGLTSFLSQFSLVLSMAVTNNMITKYGAVSAFAMGGNADIPLAVQGIVMKFFQIVVSISVGMAAGCIPVVGFNYGARKFGRCREMMRRLLIGEFLVGLVALFFFEVFPVQLISIFGSDNPDLYFQFAKMTFRIYLCLVPLDCVCKGSFIFLQSLGKPVQSTLLSLLREVALAVPLTILLPMLFTSIFGTEAGIYGLLLSMPIAVLITFIVAVTVMIRNSRVLKRQEENDQMTVSES